MRNRMHSFSTINRGEQSELCLNQFMPRERASFTQWRCQSQRWSKIMEKTKILSHQKSNSSRPSHQPVSTFSTLVMELGDWSTSCPICITIREEAPSIHWMWGLVGPTVCMDTVEGGNPSHCRRWGWGPVTMYVLISHTPSVTWTKH